MSEENNAQVPPGAPNDAQFTLKRIYLKDLSFESPNPIAAFRSSWNPKINQDLNTKVTKVDDDHFEVVLKLTIDATQEDKTAFLVEVQQAGLFLIKNVDEPSFTQIVNTMCPQILFPYAREVIDGCAVKGSFPAVALPPINFDALYVRAMKEAQKAQAEKSASGSATN